MLTSGGGPFGIQGDTSTLYWGEGAGRFLDLVVGTDDVKSVRNTFRHLSNGGKSWNSLARTFLQPLLPHAIFPSPSLHVNGTSVCPRAWWAGGGPRFREQFG